MLSRLLCLKPKSEQRNEAVHSALLPTGLCVRVDSRESGRQSLLVRICQQESTRESSSQRRRLGVGSAGRIRLVRRPVGVEVACRMSHVERRGWIAADPPAGDKVAPQGNTADAKSVKISSSYFKIEVSWRCERGSQPSPHLQRSEGADM